MIRNRKAAMGWLRLPEDDVAPLLPINFIAETAENGDCLAAGNARERTHTATSITSSWMDGGTGSFRARKLST